MTARSGQVADGTRQHEENLQGVLTRYGIERFLYRLGQSTVCERFVLKGAVLFYVWDGVPRRPMRDVDFLGYGDPSQEALIQNIRAICEVDVEPDGLTFRADTVTAEAIRDHHEYGGVRVKLLGMLGTTRIPLQIDIGFGDAVTPAPERVTFPTLLEFPAPNIQIYPPTSVITEKLEAIVKLGIVNSRVKDYYDLWVLATT